MFVVQNARTAVAAAVARNQARATFARSIRLSHGHSHSAPEPAGYAMGRIDAKSGTPAKAFFVFTAILLTSVVYRVYNINNVSDDARAEAVQYMKDNGEKFEYFLPGTKLTKSNSVV